MSRSFRLGLFILTTLAILSVCVFLVGRQQSTFGSNYRLRAEFANVSGLSEGADVRVGGTREGTVRSIQLPKTPDGKVTLTMDLAKATQTIVRQDSVASILSEGLLGDKYVEVFFGTAEGARLKGGETIESEPPFEMADLYRKASQLLDTGQGALESMQGATDNIELITGKINSGKGTMGKLVNDTTLYKQAAASVAAMHDDAEALKHNFLLRGFFKDRGYSNSAEITQNQIPQLPSGRALKSFTFDPKSLFDKSDSAKLKNEKSLNAAGQFLHGEAFDTAVISVSTGDTGDSEKQHALSEARGYVLRKYLVDTFPMDDTHLKTLAMGKNHAAGPDGTVEILIYSAPKKPGKAPQIVR